MLPRMKAYALELRERIVRFVQEGGKKTEAARRFNVGRDTVYRYMKAAKEGRLAPQPRKTYWKKLNPEKLRKEVARHPDATLTAYKERFGVSHVAIWKRLRQLGITLKKSRPVRRA
jgi:transposase